MSGLTERQKRLYATAPADDYGLETLSLFHPAWDAPEHLTNAADSFEGLVRGGLVTFTPWAFRVRLPEVGEGGRYRMQIELAATDHGRAAKLLAAAPGLDHDPAPIEAELNQFLPGETAPQDQTLALTLSNARKQGGAIVAQAALHDLLNRRFPRLLYRPDWYRGLVREDAR